MKWAVILLGLFLVSCHPLPSGKSDFKEAQLLVERTVARYPDIVRLTIHAVPTGETKSKIVACNIREKLGMISDPEDLEAMKTKRVIILREGDNLDVTAPILDRTGKAIAATGITLSCPDKTGEEALVAKAKSIAKELATAIQKAEWPLW